MTSEESSNTVPLALAELRGLVTLGFEKVNGQNALILQRLDQVDGRHAELAKRVEQLEARADALEREAVTRTDLSDRTKQIILVVGVLIALAGAVISLISLTRG
ncbi:hypothetical protein AB0B45_02320 [Nonomuraea sp. NPDC049152]|uniref:hypothetical protein n=1 Tax=Nonomuraea sp. NPDC049152 TaxID=3154350 RepID=UPI0033E19244